MSFPILLLPSHLCLYIKSEFLCFLIKSDKVDSHVSALHRSHRKGRSGPCKGLTLQWTSCALHEHLFVLLTPVCPCHYPLSLSAKESKPVSCLPSCSPGLVGLVRFSTRSSLWLARLGQLGLHRHPSVDEWEVGPET